MTTAPAPYRLPLPIRTALLKPRFEFELELELEDAAVLVLVELWPELELLEEDVAALLVCWLVVAAVLLALASAVWDGELLPSEAEDSIAPLVVAAAAGGTTVEDGALPCVMLVAMVKTPSLAVCRL